MHEDMTFEGLREGVARGSTFWTALLIIIIVFLILSVVLRFAVKRVADQRTRRIILEGMKDDSPTESSGSTTDSTTDSTQTEDTRSGT
ncbi:MAG: hypothetical protein ABI333_21400 [bacterium]